MEALSDISLVAQVAVFHNKRAFDQLVRKYQSPVRRFFLGQTLGDTQLSDDLAQETFLKTYTHIASFKGLSGFSTWLFRIAYNVLLDYRRSQKITDDIDTSALRNTESRSSDPTLRMDLYSALALLKPEERTCITLQLMEGLAIDKIAEVTQLPLGTVKSHLSRGKKQLANYLRENGYGRNKE
ncbi:MAG: sigma-70 family RNA polymerase sigma factor [Prevotella sp.]|nr:sigma-70 family RNA polymerase sigma factor [Prevotella sp.]